MIYIPIFITCLSFFLAYLSIPESKGDYSFGPAIIGCAVIPLAGFVSMFAWFIWALLK